MRIRYDGKSDTMTLVFDDGDPQVKECGDGISVGYGVDGHLLWLEIREVLARSGRRDLFRRLIFEGIGPSADPLIILPRLFDNPLQVEE